MGRYSFSDYIFLGALTYVSFVAFTTGHLIPILLMVIFGAWAVYRYAWQSAQQRQVHHLLNLAQAARDTGNTKDALKLYQKAIYKQPKNASLYCDAGQIKLTERNYEEALNDFQTALKLWPGNPGIHLMITSSYCGLKKYQKALAINNEIINSSPMGAQAFMGYLGRGAVFIELQKIDRALSDFIQANKLKPDFFLTHCCLAEAFCYIGEFGKGLDSAQRAIDLFPSLSVAYLWRGWAKYGLGQYEEGLKDCCRAISQDPKFGKSYEVRGLIYKAMGQLDLALKDLEKALTLYREYELDQFLENVMPQLNEVRQDLDKDLKE